MSQETQFLQLKQSKPIPIRYGRCSQKSPKSRSPSFLKPSGRRSRQPTASWRISRPELRKGQPHRRLGAAENGYLRPWMVLVKLFPDLGCNSQLIALNPQHDPIPSIGSLVVTSFTVVVEPFVDPGFFGSPVACHHTQIGSTDIAGTWFCRWKRTP